MLWFTRHGSHTLHILRDEYVFQMPVHFGESYFLIFAFDCQGKKVGKNTEVVSLFHLNCGLEGKSYHSFSRTILIELYVAVSVSSRKSPVWSESGRG